MKLLKKSFLSILILVLAISMIACEGKKQEPTPEEGTSAYSVTYNGTAIELGKPAADVLTALGEPLSTQEVCDCGEGKSRVLYQFSSFDLYTMKMDGSEVIDELALYDDLVETAEKISIGMSEAEVRTVYGEPLSEENGTLSYASGDYHLSFDIENGKVSAIGLLRKTN